MVTGPRLQSTKGENRGQSEPVGVALLLGITILGSIAVLGFGSVSLDSARTSSQIEGTVHAMTQLDSQVAVVALGDSDVQRFSLGRSGRGSYSVRPNKGWINISHVNRTGSGGSETILNQTMGRIVYERNDRTIAYQGGGVWLERDGNSHMVSPPEFHYRSATLTLPLIRILGSDNAAGRVSGRIILEQRSRRIFPNASTPYSVGSGNYQNPIEDGKVIVTVHSDYYRAWAEYFRTRSSGEVTVFESNETVELTLLTRGTIGDFEMPAEGDSIDVEGLGEAHAITEFNITLIDDDSDSANFANLKWSMTVQEGGQRMEIHLRDGSGPKCGGDAELHIYYANQSGAFYQGWTNTSAFQYECESAPNDYNDDGDYDDVRLIVSLTSNTKLTYVDDPKLMEYSTGGDTFVNPTTFDEHQSQVSWESKTFNPGDESTINRVTNHYFSLFAPSFNIEINDKPADTVNEDDSYGTLEQEGEGGNFLTFLHITENEIRIEFE